MNDGTPENLDLSPLCEGDRAALAWLANHGWEAADPPPAIADRVAAMRAIAALVSGGSQPLDEALCRRVAQACGAVGDAAPEPVLCEADADALDAWMISGHRSERVPAGLRSRAAVHDGVAALLAARPAVLADVRSLSDLTERTMAATDGAHPSEEVAAGRTGSRWRLLDLVSVAAVLLISASVLWPVIGSARQHAVREANRANMAVAGIGFGAYAAEHDDRLPSVSDADRGPDWAWWKVGEDPQKSNSANLYTLHRAGYTPADAFDSPGNPDAATPTAETGALDWEAFEQVSYSMTLAGSLRAMQPDASVVLADRSPVTLAIHRGVPIRFDANSPNHRGRGQHVLRADGSVVWLDTPRLADGDHLYLAESGSWQGRIVVEGQTLTFTALGVPQDDRDAFVAP